MALKSLMEDHDAKQAAWDSLLVRYREKNLLAGISREQFEASMKIGFDEAWELQQRRAASAAA